MKKIGIILLALIYMSSSVYAAMVENVDVVNHSQMDVSFSSDVSFSVNESLSADIQVFKDVEISYANRDTDDANQAIISLYEDILPNADYSLIGIFGADGTIDFSTNDTVVGYEAVGSENETGGILRIEIVDTRTMHVFFNNPLVEEVLEFKLLNGIHISNTTISSAQSISLELSDLLAQSSEYILMILSLNDTNGVVFLDEELYDVMTSDNLTEQSTTPTLAEAIVEKEEQAAEEEMVEVALNAAETPDTGAATWVLLLLTAMINGGLYINKKRK